MLEQSAGQPLDMKIVLEPAMAAMQIFNHKEPPIKLGDFDERNIHLDNVDAKATFNDLQALLCPASLNCFSLTMRKWFAASIDNLSEIDWSTSAWDHLVLDQQKKWTIRTLVANHRTKSRSPDEEVMTGDVIERKGSVCRRFIVSRIRAAELLITIGARNCSLWSSRSWENPYCWCVILVWIHIQSCFADALVESVAEYTQRPLYAINVGEVTSEERVRARLQQVFAQASKWNAVLLLDEADVVLEKR